MLFLHFLLSCFARTFHKLFAFLDNFRNPSVIQEFYASFNLIFASVLGECCVINTENISIKLSKDLLESCKSKTFSHFLNKNLPISRLFLILRTFCHSYKSIYVYIFAYLLSFLLK